MSASSHEVRFTVWDTVGETWIRELETTLARITDLDWGVSRADQPSEFILISSRLPGIDQKLAALDADSHFVVLVESEGPNPSEWFLKQHVDDVLVTPFRTSEIVSKLRAFERWKSLVEVSELNDSFSGVVEQLKEDVLLAERMQRARVPKPFGELKGYDMHSRYFAGARAGGDYFDVVQSPGQRTLSMILTDSSSYGLSSAVLQSLMRVAARMEPETTGSSAEAVKRVWSEVSTTLSAKDQLSMFYGSIDQRTRRMNYVHAGGARVFHAAKGQPFRELTPQSSAWNADSKLDGLVASEMNVQAEDRFVLCSDGFVEGVGGADVVAGILSQNVAADVKTLVTELTYRLKSRMKKTGTGGDEFFPEQDTTVVVFEVKSNVVALKPRET